MRCAFLLLVVVLLGVLLDDGARGEEARYTMPVYPASEPPPMRDGEEVEAVLAGAAVGAEAPTDSKADPLRVVLVAGPKDHGPGEHDYPAWQKVWARLLAEAPATSVDKAWEFPSADQIDRADVLVFYQRGQWDDARAAAIDPFLARGGGLVYIHWAVDGRGGEVEMARRIGLSALGGSIKYRHGRLQVDLAPGADHPICRNLERATWIDESYWGLTGDPEQIRTLGVSIEEEAPQPQFWTVERGRGRVFVSIPGHYMWTFDDPLFRVLLLRGIAWAGHRDVDRFNSLVWLDARVAK